MTKLEFVLDLLTQHKTQEHKSIDKYVQSNNACKCPYTNYHS